uniref:YiaA/YiaB family inner membrane protein n=3 Tax=Escherichia coli TaxID=562 RepID=UPI0024E1683D
MKTSKTVAKLLFVVGALVYLVGLWISCPLLSGKGYFLGVLMTATFGNYAYLRAEKLGQLDDFFTHICQLVALIPGFAPIFPDTCYHLTHYWLAAVDIPV